MSHIILFVLVISGRGRKKKQAGPAENSVKVTVSNEICAEKKITTVGLFKFLSLQPSCQTCVSLYLCESNGVREP